MTGFDKIEGYITESFGIGFIFLGALLILNKSFQITQSFSQDGNFGIGLVILGSAMMGVKWTRKAVQNYLN